MCSEAELILRVRDRERAQSIHISWISTKSLLYSALIFWYTELYLLVCLWSGLVVIKSCMYFNISFECNMASVRILLMYVLLCMDKPCYRGETGELDEEMVERFKGKYSSRSSLRIGWVFIELRAKHLLHLSFTLLLRKWDPKLFSEYRFHLVMPTCYFKYNRCYPTFFQSKFEMFWRKLTKKWYLKAPAQWILV